LVKRRIFADGGDGAPRGGNGGYFLLQSQAMHTNVRVGNDIEMFSESPQEAGDEFDEDLVAKKLVCPALKRTRTLVGETDRSGDESRKLSSRFLLIIFQSFPPPMEWRIAP
jgi:hypothetical protein